MKFALALDALIAVMRDELALAIRASKDAGEYATHDEARAKSQWDTQGLESSYLAAGQAGRAEDIATAIQELERLRNGTPDEGIVGVGALVECDWGDLADWFLIVRKGGGTTAKVGKLEVTTISPESALGCALDGKRTGEHFKLGNGNTGTVGGVMRS